MSGFTTIQEGNVQLIHHSTSSLIELVIKHEDPTETGGSEIRYEHTWLDYESVKNLIIALDRTRDDFIPVNKMEHGKYVEYRYKDYKEVEDKIKSERESGWIFCMKGKTYIDDQKYFHTSIMYKKTIST